MIAATVHLLAPVCLWIFGVEISPEDQTIIIDKGAALWTLAAEFVAYVLTLYGRAVAKEPVKVPFARMATIALFVGCCAMIVGCGTQQRTGFDQVLSKATPANQLITDGDTLAASSLNGQPNYTVLNGPDGGPAYETVQELASTNLGLILPGGQLVYSSPKTLDVAELIITRPDGTEISLGQFSAGTEAPYTAKADWITEMADVAKLMSADQREQFLAAVSAVDSIAAAAIQALIPAP